MPFPRQGIFSLPLLVALAAALLLAGLSTATPAQAVSTSVVISQVYGGGNNSGATYQNDFVELFNRGTVATSLNGWSIQYTSATGTGLFSSNTLALPNVNLGVGQYYLIQLAGGTTNGIALPTADYTGTINMSGSSGKVVLSNQAAGLACNGGSTACSTSQLAAIVDLVGYGTANFFEGSAAAPGLSNTTAALRAGNGCTDTDQNGSDFTAPAPAPHNTSTTAYTCPTDTAPTVTDVNPPDGTTGVSVSTNIAVTFSEAVNVTGAWFTLVCGTSGSHTATVTGGPTTFTLDPDSDFASSEICTLTIIATQVSDQDSIDPPNNMETNFVSTLDTHDYCPDAFTPIYDLQGSGPTTPMTGTVTTKGVVIGDYEGPTPALRGYYIQDATGDGDPATSDGLFVFTGGADTVSLGELARVTGTITEFQGQTELDASAVLNCGTGTVAPTDVNLPFSSADYPERYEGMLVKLPQTLYVTEHFQLGRFGQVSLSSGARLIQPTMNNAPGAAAQAAQAANDLNQILIDDDTQNQNPDPIIFGRGGNPLSASNTLRGGDTVSNIVGVMTYTWGGNGASPNAYRVRPATAMSGGIPNFQATNARPITPDAVGGDLKVVSMNLLNFFTTLDNAPNNCTGGVGGAAMDCRGAESQTEFDRQYPKTVAAIVAMNPDVLGVNEIENNGYDSASAIAFLTDKLNDAFGAGTYAYIDVDTETGQVNALGTDAIKVGMLYKPAKVTPVGVAALNTTAFVNGGDSAPRSRPSLAVAFETANGARVVVDVNHLKSKGSACDDPDAGDGQGNCNIVRTNAASQLATWLATDPTNSGGAPVLIMGDLNSYAKEDPVKALETAGYTNLIASEVGSGAYSYVFDGQWGYLDYALGDNALLSRVTGVVVGQSRLNFVWVKVR